MSKKLNLAMLTPVMIELAVRQKTLGGQAAKLAAGQMEVRQGELAVALLHVDNWASTKSKTELSPLIAAAVAYAKDGTVVSLEGPEHLLNIMDSLSKASTLHGHRDGIGPLAAHISDVLRWRTVPRPNKDRKAHMDKPSRPIQANSIRLATALTVVIATEGKSKLREPFRSYVETNAAIMDYYHRRGQTTLVPKTFLIPIAG